MKGKRRKKIQLRLSSGTGNARYDKSGEDERTAGEPRPRIPDGEYTAICHQTRIAKSFGGRREMYVLFRVYGGPFDGAELPMFCTFPPGKLSRSTKLYRQYSIAMGGTPLKGERVSGKAFRGKMYRIIVGTSKAKHDDGTLLPDFLQYSVVRGIKEVMTGVPEQ